MLIFKKKKCLFIEVALDNRTAFPFEGGETTMLQILNHFIWETDAVASYKETRNGMIG